MHGTGVLYGKDGSVYKGKHGFLLTGKLGDFVRGKKHGFGTYTWKDGRLYDGPFFEGKQHGVGKYIAVGGKTKIGKWEHGVRVAWISEEVESDANKGRESNKTLQDKDLGSVILG